MLIFPAIDLRGGKVVRLWQGDYDRMTVYSDDPVETAKGFLYAGAECMHVVDLDGAKDGSPKNRDVIRTLCKLPLEIEVGGGIRDESTVNDMLSLGVRRVILGSAAVTDFPFARRMGKLYGGRIAAGVDVKDGLVAIHGWTDVSDLNGFDFCQKLLDAGISTVIYTDISKDGLLEGTNLGAYRQLQTIEGLRVIASGGISYEEEIKALRDLGVYGAIIGKALYAGKLSLTRALDIAGGAA
ncbi:MAG: 1-(5-phosphoribosyl)-5-[(5-phosphoribosylamino)methylideneamino]imidazole-4-carboxamide isomerase [Bacillota bacterium]